MAGRKDGVASREDALRTAGALTAEKAAGLTIRVGRKFHPIADYADASRMTEAAVAALMRTGARMSDSFKSPIIYAGNQPVAYVSLNGRVWAGDPRDWQPGAKPLYDNRDAQAA